MSRLDYVVHSVIYYLAWFAGIAFAAHHFPMWSALSVCGFILLQIAWVHHTQQPLKPLGILLLILLLISTCVDSLFVYQRWVIYTGNPFFPYFTTPWMITLWLSFGVFLYATLSQLFDHLCLLALLSFSGFTFAFWVGGQLGAVTFPEGAFKTCCFIGLVWAILLPLCILIYRTIQERL